MSANGSINANRDFGQIAREILAEAAEIDRCEDELYGSGGGDELPEHLRTGEGRRKTVGEAQERLEASAATLPRRRATMTRRSPWGSIRVSAARGTTGVRARGPAGMPPTL